MLVLDIPIKNSPYIWHGVDNLLVIPMRTFYIPGGRLQPRMIWWPTFVIVHVYYWYNLVGGWTNRPFDEKYESKWVHLPQFSGWTWKNIWVATTYRNVWKKCRNTYHTYGSISSWNPLSHNVYFVQSSRRIDRPVPLGEDVETFNIGRRTCIKPWRSEVNHKGHSRNQTLHPRKLTCPLKRDYFSIGNTSSNHWFSGDMLVFRQGRHTCSRV